MEQQVWDRRWENGYCFPYRNIETGRYYAKDIYDGSIIPKSYSKSLRELRRKVKDYVSENLTQREAAKTEGTEKVSLQLFKELNLHIACILFGYVQIFCTLMP